jgi:ketosteroid isomerase-like protein
MLGPPAAGLVVYLAVVFAWLSVAAIGFGRLINPPHWLPWAVGSVLGAGYVVSLYAASRYVHRRLPKWSAGPNEDLVHRGYRAFAKRQTGTLGRGLASDVVWHLEGSKEHAHDYRGCKQVLEFLERTMGLADGNFQAELCGVVADKEYAISLHVARGEGERSEDRHALVFQIRGERIKEVWHYIPNQDAHDWFFSKTAGSERPVADA